MANASNLSALRIRLGLSGNMGVERLKPAPNDYLQRWAVSKRVNNSKADKGITVTPYVFP
jgi:hypothetical protein